MFLSKKNTCLSYWYEAYEILLTENMFYKVYPGTCISKSFSYPSTATYNFKSWDREAFCDYMYGLIYAAAENNDLFNKM